MSKQIIENNYLKDIQTILETNQLSLYELNWNFEYESNVLQILVENKDTSIRNVEFDALISANEAISQLLDKDTAIKEPYILEVASAGAERQVKTQEMLINNVGQYFFINSTIAFEGVTEFNATLNSFDNKSQEFNFSFFIKGKPKKVNLKFEQISFIRFAIKF
ncbi:ribosome assembly cofactor RimP [Spiroplasma culicicola]|uniref:Ribosome maturation factor RimP n=1 Tax=Spiroplasma culicicola AES-1 TaxID=1276246 RepID=W6A7G3_9MOLU|nr:ribosome assembly cofactor RimP [Spiroplasma culicicola]AHI53083.1 ribosome maturation factor RimP [Spiroplasma culicicola AES-1]